MRKIIARKKINAKRNQYLRLAKVMPALKNLIKE